MKTAIIRSPKNGEVNLAIAASRPRRYFVIGRRKQLLLLSSLLICTVALWFGGVITKMMANATAEAQFAAAPTAVAQTEAPKEEAPKKTAWLKQILAAVTPQKAPTSRVMPFDGSRPLKRGDKVVVAFSDGTIVAEVAGTPNESVLLRRGHLLERLYVLGENSYAVMVHNQSKLVRGSDIYATVDAAVQLARN